MSSDQAKKLEYSNLDKDIDKRKYLRNLLLDLKSLAEEMIDNIGDISDINLEEDAIQTFMDIYNEVESDDDLSVMFIAFKRSLLASE